jgi:hypothetical protein
LTRPTKNRTVRAVVALFCRVVQFLRVPNDFSSEAWDDGAAANRRTLRWLGDDVKSRIMYIEFKGHDVTGPARIGRVTFSKTGKTLYYAGKTFERLTPCGYKRNYRDAQTGDLYWISGCHRDGNDGLYGGCDAEIDEDVRVEYWTTIRGKPDNVASTKVNR